MFTSPLVVAMLGIAFVTFPVNYLLLAILTVVIGAALLMNLGFLHRMTGKIDESISKAA